MHDTTSAHGHWPRSPWLSRGHRRQWLAFAAAATAVLTLTAAAVAATGTDLSAAGDGPDGVAQIYPTKPGGQTWFMDDNPDDDPRFSPGSISRNSDGSWRSRSGKVRMGVRTETYGGRDDEDELVWRQSDLRERGYMFDSNDWRDVEMTGYVRLNDADDDAEEFTWYARGARHTGDDTAPEACWGSAYKGSIGYTRGKSRVDKEVYHVGYAFQPWRGDFGSIEDKWIGFKVVMHNLPDGSVKLENYADLGADNQWRKVYDYIDDGGWSIKDSYPDNPCHGANDEILTWGGPIATFRWDDANSVDFKKFSVREIDPNGEPGDPSPTASPTAPPGGSEDLPVSAVTASEHDGNVPANTRDGDFATRWSAEAVNRSEWIRFDLGATRSVHHLKVAWHRGDQRRARYQLQVSADGVSWSTVATGQSSGATTGFETYDFPDTTGQHVRIVSDGNTDNDWVSVSEVKIFGGSQSGGTTTKDLPVTTATASSDDGHRPDNTRDNSLSTRWSAQGDGQWISYDLGETDESIHHVKVAWHRGDQRRARFDVQASADGTSWDTLLADAESSGESLQLETYDFPDTESKYRFVRLIGHGNTENNWNSITEVKLFGCCSGPKDGPTAGMATDYEKIRSLLWQIFAVDTNGEPQNVDRWETADIDNYYGTRFIYHSNTGRDHELLKYIPKDNPQAAPIWGWNYERYRDGDDYHQAERFLADDASYPLKDGDLQQREALEHNSYHGRIWCYWGKDMVITTQRMMLAMTGLHGQQLEGASRVVIQIVANGAELAIDPVYDGAMPEHDYCTEAGYIE